jgi:LDH2 family malate/lactate/ureidoglycolate dehydrogenase
MMKITVKELEKLTSQALKNSGYNAGEIQIMTDVLLYAQLRGNNQGVVKLIGQGMPKNPNAGEIKIVKETPISARIDGSQNQAMVVMGKAVTVAIEKAKKSGFGIVGTFNTSTSSGAVGYYATRIARKRLIGFVFGRSTERVAMYGSYEPVFGTNPIAIAVPAEPSPVVLDMSTAAISFFGLVEARTAGKQIPDDLAYDAQGNPTADPASAIQGAIRSFDRSYKGSGLGMMAEILAGPLVGAAFAGIGNSKQNWGHLVFAIDPDFLGDRSEFIENVGRMIEKIKATKKLPGVEEIFVPGEREAQLFRQCEESGEIDIEENLLKGLRIAAKGK